MGKKGVDRGNKRRFFKNLFRFVKHPIGYINWKLHRYIVMPKFIVAMFIASWLAALI